MYAHTHIYIYIYISQHVSRHGDTKAYPENE